MVRGAIFQSEIMVYNYWGYSTSGREQTVARIAESPNTTLLRTPKVLANKIHWEGIFLINT
jgi:hypothetical protein